MTKATLPNFCSNSLRPVSRKPLPMIRVSSLVLSRLSCLQAMLFK